MATKSVIKLRMIHDFFGVYGSKAIRRGENALESGHLLSFTYDDELSHIMGDVRASQTKKKLYLVKVFFNQAKITEAECNCARGLVGCHHIAALLLHANKTLSITDKCSMFSHLSAKWTVRKKKQAESTPALPIEELIQQQKRKPYRALKFSVTANKLKKLKEGIKNCKGAAASMYWLLGDEPPIEDPEVSTNNAVLHPLDVIFSPEYAKSADKITFLTNVLQIEFPTVKDIASATVGQSENPLWVITKTKRITASNFGDVLKVYSKTRNKGIPSDSLMKKLLHPAKLDKIKAVMWGKMHEPVALRKLTCDYGLQVTPTGVWLHVGGLLGASPDGLVGEDAVVEVKCPYSFRNDVLSVVLSKRKDYIIYLENGSWHINQDHEYFHQIQGQMHFTRRTLCYLVVWTTKSMEVMKVPIEPSWSANIAILHRFFCDQLVTYIKKWHST